MSLILLSRHQGVLTLYTCNLINSLVGEWRAQNWPLVSETLIYEGVEL
jgi:hypothetical protein